MDYPTDDETALWVALNIAQRTIYQAIDAALKAEDLPPLRWYDVLWSIERAAGDGRRAYELEHLLLFEQSNLSRLLRRMVDEDLVSEAVFERDRRGKVLRITSKGRRVRKQMWNVYGPLLHSYIGRLAKAHDPRELAVALECLMGREAISELELLRS